MKIRSLTLTMLAVGLLTSAPLAAQGVEQRLERMERLMSSQGLMEMMQRLDRQEREIQQLRGQIEEQNHSIENLRSRQRELYLDTDRRLSRIEREGVASPSGSAAPSTLSGESSPSQAALTASAPVPLQDEEQAKREREAYQKAFELLRELRYDEATAAFREFMGQFPNGRYAHIAQYWLGEASYTQRQFEQAIKDYQQLLDRFPNSPKRAEAMLKIGYSWNEQGEQGKARAILEKLVQDFPNSTEAGQARNLLGQL